MLYYYCSRAQNITAFLSVWSFFFFEPIKDYYNDLIDNDTTENVALSRFLVFFFFFLLNICLFLLPGCHRIFSSPLNHIYLHKQSSRQQRRNFIFRRQREISHSIVFPAAVSPAHPVPKVLHCLLSVAFSSQEKG